MNSDDGLPQRTCQDCKQEFDSSFDLVDHLLEEDEEFDPYLVLPNGYKLMLGSMMRFFYENAENPEKIKLITESTFITLFAFENGYQFPQSLIEDMIVNSSMQDFDKGLDDLLNPEV